MDAWIELYLAELSASEKIAYEIAKEHLQSSFDLEKSIGFQKWLKIKKAEKEIT
tara:strand:+ start:6029 stop:6190 length:162 start_codon:yes stop_codon:yes gene_type:complete